MIVITLSKKELNKSSVGWVLTYTTIILIEILK